MKILVLEDDVTIGNGLEYSLTSEGYQVTLVTCVGDAKSVINNKFDLCLLDINLPDGNGYDVCKLIKSKSDTPVIFLTAYDDEVNVVMGLEIGADDYISKPFRVRELLARIKVVLKRNLPIEANIINIGNVSVNTLEGKVYKNSELVFMTALEYRLFLTLINNRSIVVTRNQILENIWDVAGDFVNDNTLSVYIKRIREKIEDEPNNPVIIKTVRGLGYRVD